MWRRGQIGLDALRSVRPDLTIPGRRVCVATGDRIRPRDKRRLADQNHSEWLADCHDNVISVAAGVRNADEVVAEGDCRAGWEVRECPRDRQRALVVDQRE